MRADRRPASWFFGAAFVWGALSLWKRGLRRASLLHAVATPESLRRAGLLAVGALLIAHPARAQGQPPDSVEVVIPAPAPSMGGIARYEGSGRRDPFTPLFVEGEGGVSGPRFEQLKVTGIFRGGGANSLVVLEDPTHRGYFVRLGQTIGSARLVEILPQAAVFEVREHDASRRVVLRLERAEERR